MARPATLEAAEAYLASRQKNNNYYFDYIDLGSGPVPLKVNLSNGEFDSQGYDTMHGEGAAASIISALRKEMIKNYQSADKNSFAYLLSVIGSAIASKEEKVSDELLETSPKIPRV